MELVVRNAAARVSEAHGSARSIVDPLELSGRPDASSAGHRGEVRRTKSALPAVTTPVAESDDLAVVDPKLVDETAAWICRKVATTLKIGAQQVGEYVLDQFFGSDPNLAKSKCPNKSASFRALAEKCATPTLPVSKTWLNNAVGVAVMVRQLPETARAFKELPPSYQETLLPLGDPTRVEKVAKQAATKDWSYRELRQVVAEERTRIPNGASRGPRPRTPLIVKTLRRSLKLFLPEDGKRSFTRMCVEELDERQREDAIASAEGLIDKLKDLVSQLKKA